MDGALAGAANRKVGVVMDFYREITGLRSQLAAAEAESNVLMNEVARERARAEALEAELTAANAQIHELGRQLAEAGEARIAAEAENRELRAELERREAGSVRDAERIAQLREAGDRLAAAAADVHPTAPSSKSITELHGAIDEWDGAALTASPSDYRERVRIEHDGFEGDVIGHYQTREGKRGVVLQQHGTRVVHVYGEKWVRALGDSNANG